MVIQSAEYDFWHMFIDKTLEVARKIPNVTDSYLRQEAYSYKTLWQLETTRLNTFLSKYNLAPSQIKKLSDDDFIKIEYNSIIRRVRIFKALHERYSDVLYARVCMKDEKGIVAYFIQITVPEEKEYWLYKMKDEFLE